MHALRACYPAPPSASDAELPLGPSVRSATAVSGAVSIQLLGVTYPSLLFCVASPVFYDKTALLAAIEDWAANAAAAEAQYGPIGQWDVSRLTDFSSAFKNQATANADINAWEVSSATTMQYMFSDASAFNSDLAGWDVSQVTNMQVGSTPRALWLQLAVRPRVAYAGVGRKCSNRPRRSPRI